MKRFFAVLSVVALALVFSGCGKRLSKEEMIKRGEYLVKGCGVLKEHTPFRDGRPDMTKFMAGSSIGYQGPWGVHYPKNLTPDTDTGIGLLTDDEIIAEIKGDSSNKPNYFADYYRNLTDEDLRCVMMYLKTLEPVSNKVPADLKPGERVSGAVINLAPSTKTASAPAVKKTTATTAKKTTVKAPVKTTSTKASTAKKTTTTKRK